MTTLLSPDQAEIADPAGREGTDDDHLEALTHALLEALATLGHLDSTYLTVLDWNEFLVVRNARKQRTAHGLLTRARHADIPSPALSIRSWGR